MVVIVITLSDGVSAQINVRPDDDCTFGTMSDDLHNLTIFIPSSMLKAAQNWSHLPPSQIAEYAPGHAATVAIAIRELREYLEQTGALKVTLNSGAAPTCSNALHVQVDHSISGYKIARAHGTIELVVAKSRFLLAAVYDLLHQLGFAWYAPAKNWWITPESLNWEHVTFRHVEDQAIGLRGVFTYDADIPDAYLLWMARNGLNLVGAFGANARLAEALGISLDGGGHNVISTFLNSDQSFEGEPLIKARPEWYGVSAEEYVDQVPRGAQKYRNPCLAHAGLVHYLARKLGAALVDGIYQNVDILHVWPSDQLRLNIPDGCVSPFPGARDVDHLFVFYGRLVSELNRYLVREAPGRRVTVAGISYHDTWEQPDVRSLKDLRSRENVRYMHVFYMIERSYSSALLYARENWTNARIARELESWIEVFNQRDIDVGVCEYFNYSSYAALPAMYAQVLPADLAFYARLGVDLITYMHPLGGNQGMQRVTNLLWSRYASSQARGQDALTTYFRGAYGVLATDVRHAYAEIDLAFSNLAEMLGPVSSLRLVGAQEYYWSKPPLHSAQATTALKWFLRGNVKRLPQVRDTHFAPLVTAFVGAQDSLRYADSAIRTLEKALQRAQQPPVKLRIREDLKWARFGRDAYRLLVFLAESRLTGSFDAETFRNMRKSFNRGGMFGGTLSALDQQEVFDAHLDGFIEAIREIQH